MLCSKGNASGNSESFCAAAELLKELGQAGRNKGFLSTFGYFQQACDIPDGPVIGRANGFSHFAAVRGQIFFQQKFGIETTAHMDPIATDDESVNRLREQVAALARAVEPEMTIHDFRVTKGPQHTNLIFDVVVPHRCRLRDEELCERLSGAVRALDERYFAVIQVDRAYVETR